MFNSNTGQRGLKRDRTETEIRLPATEPKFGNNMADREKGEVLGLTPTGARAKRLQAATIPIPMEVGKRERGSNIHGGG